MDNKRTVAERLRDIRGKGCSANAISRAVFNESMECIGSDCSNCSKELANKLAAAIEAEQAERHQPHEVDVDALLKVADDMSELVDVPPYKAHAVCSSTIRNWRSTISNAVKDAKHQLPDGIQWPRFDDGELVKFARYRMTVGGI